MTGRPPKRVAVRDNLKVDLARLFDGYGPENMKLYPLKFYHEASVQS